jgi:hypothetical protein
MLEGFALISSAFLTQDVDSSKKNTSLTAAEASALWTQYMGDTMAVCVFTYFVNLAEDNEIKPILEFALQLAKEHIAKITAFFNDANFQVPRGFTETDVNPTAPRLFTDQFLVFYSYIMTIHGLSAYSLALSNCERRDIQDYYFECIETTKQLFQKIVNYSKSQPKFSGVPSVPSLHEVEFIHSTGFISNLFGDKRPLNSSEISNLFFNSKKTGFVRTLSLAFSQVAQVEEVRDFLLTNVTLAGKDADSFDSILKEDDLSIPQRWDDEVTDSTESPFSDKLIMFHAAFLVNAALTYYGASIGSSLRSDIILNYMRVFNHAMEAGAICYNLMVKHDWLEKQPHAIDRDALSKGSTQVT